MSSKPSFNPRRDPQNQTGNGYSSDGSTPDFVTDTEREVGVVGTPMPVVATGTTRTGVGPTYVTPTSEVVNRETNINVASLRDRVRWGPILAGLVSAVACLLIFSLLGAAVGLTAAAGDPNGATGAANSAGNYGTGAAIWAAVSALLSFFIGGFVASRTAAVYGKGYGWVNGALVWATAIPLLLLLASSGASGFLNAAGFNLSSFTDTISNTVNNPATNPANNPNQVQSVTEAARNGVWGALIALLLGLIAAGLGGLLGGRSKDEAHDSTYTTTANR